MRAFAAAESSRESRWAASAIALFYGALAALVAGLALAAATGWPPPGVVMSAIAFGVLVALLTRLTGSGPIRGWMAVAGRAAIAVAIGVVVGEIAALAVFAGAIDRSLDDAAARSADAAPAVMQASTALAQTRAARTELDIAVDQSRVRLDEALVVARCEYNPSPACPIDRITGMPGRGPETLTANELLADARQELDSSLAARERRAPELDAAIIGNERVLANAQANAVATADRGLGARWVAMHDHTLAGPGPLLLRLVTIAFSVLLSLLPLILGLWRSQTSDERRAAALAERERAELEADTAIAVKRAEVRRSAEILWAEQQLASARLAVDAQHEIDRALHRRRVAQALGGRPVDVGGQHELAGPQEGQQGQERSQQEGSQQEQDQVAAEVSEQKQLSSAVPSLPARADEYLPARAASEVAERGQIPLISTLPEFTRSAARWVRPLVPSIVAKAIDSTTHPVRTARQVFEEVEEIHFSLRRTHTMAVHSVESPSSGEKQELADQGGGDMRRRVESSTIRSDLGGIGADDHADAIARSSPDPRLDAGEHRARSLPESDGVRQLPPGR